MYHAFIADREGWGAFFRKYQDKLVFGTDMVDSEGDVVFDSQDPIVDFCMKTLVGNEPFSVKDISGVGLGLSQPVLDKILANNFESRVGTPKAISQSGLNAYVEYLMPRLTAEQRKRAEDLMA